MSQRKTKIRFFTVADFLEEENWLREEQKDGWKLVKMVPPCFYVFEECRPEDVIYRLDFKNNQQKADYMQMVDDFGWEYCAKCFGWLYFRKPAAETENTGDMEIFSDNGSRLEMVERIVKTRMLPLLVIFFCTVIPNLIKSLDNCLGYFFTGVCGTIFLIYVFLLIYCGTKLRKIKSELT